MIARYRMLVMLLVAAATLSGVVSCASSLPHATQGTSLVTVTASRSTSSHVAVLYLQIKK